MRSTWDGNRRGVVHGRAQAVKALRSACQALMLPLGAVPFPPPCPHTPLHAALKLTSSGGNVFADPLNLSWPGDLH